MNKQQLIAALDKYPNDVQILLATDPEGNTFSTLDEGFSIEYVEADYAGGQTDAVFNGEDLSEDSEDGNIPETFRQVLVFWPV